MSTVQQLCTLRSIKQLKYTKMCQTKPNKPPPKPTTVLFKPILCYATDVPLTHAADVSGFAVVQSDNANECNSISRWQFYSHEITTFTHLGR